MSDKGSVAAVARAIERYLKDNPAAADTASGIRGWWLPSALRAELSVVVSALDLLETQGMVDKTIRQGGEVIYSSNVAARHWNH
jgi:Fe2+ or Zn2+ uptake regulation protein